MNISRRDFIKGFGLIVGATALGIAPEVSEPEFPEFVEYSIDDDVLEEAITVGGTHIKDGRAWVDLDIDTDKAWQAIRIYCTDGTLWQTLDGGETWQSMV